MLLEVVALSFFEYSHPALKGGAGVGGWEEVDILFQS